MNLRILAVLGVVLPCLDVQAGPESKPAEPSGHVFAWPFMEWEKMKPRGGTTRGSEVTLLKESRPAWEALQEEGLTKQERDRRAILAMAGEFRVSFDFVETLGFGADYEPPRPYFSWGTEHVEVIEDRPSFVSLQHTLVMYFKNEDGEVQGPAVMKHWRQDWSYEPATILTYRGNETWEKIPAPEPAGRWAQAVFQVDDSPRYEVMGEWTHEGGLSSWLSDNCPRPLPRREFSVRDDYNILEGHHQITLAPTSWLHTQDNRKLRIGDDGSKTYVGLELGVDRYEAITEPELAAGFAASWAKTAPYWAQVRKVWADLIASRDRFTLVPENQGEKLWQQHFAKAAELEAAENPDHSGNAEHAQATIEAFLRKDGEKAPAGKY